MDRDTSISHAAATLVGLILFSVVYGGGIGALYILHLFTGGAA
ncbi:hypothetical protein [Rhodococcus rhodochrous]|nr:hypothetical protein [Rhodococcus rhodochrous]